MRRLLSLATAGLLGSAVAAPLAAQSQDRAEETVTITADVVDLSCKYVQNASGVQHKMCAEVCADKGQPLGLLTADGQFLLPVNGGMGAAGENARLKPFAEEKVTVTGKIIRRGGVNAIVIEKISKA
jgi:hypothetical protein